MRTGKSNTGTSNTIVNIKKSQPQQAVGIQQKCLGIFEVPKIALAIFEHFKRQNELSKPQQAAEYELILTNQKKRKTKN